MTDQGRDEASARATGASLAAIVLIAGAFAAIMLLHLLRTDLDPVREVMSAYANGSFGPVMTGAFYALGIAALLMAFRLLRATHRTMISRSVVVLLAVSGMGLIVAGVFEVELPEIPDTMEEVVHSDAALGAFVLLIAAMLLFTLVCRADPRWRGFSLPAIALAAIATVAAGLSPIADKTPLSGVAQRLLGATVFAWLLLLALRIRFHPAHRPLPDQEPA